MSHKEQEDHSDLIKKVALLKDRDAFKTLFDYYSGRLISFSLKAGVTREAAEEIMQESMAALWHKAVSFNPAKASPKTWIYTITRNKRIDFLRRNARPLPDPADITILLEQPVEPDTLVEARETRDMMSTFLEKLPLEQLDVIRKAFFEDKSHATVATELGLPLGTVKSRIRLALGHLRRLMETSL